MQPSELQISRRLAVLGATAWFVTANGPTAMAQDDEQTFTGAFSGLTVDWSDSWSKMQSASSADSDYILLQASTPDAGQVSLQLNVMSRPWATLADAERDALNDWVETFDGAKSIEEIVETWTGEDAVGHVFREDWSGDVSTGYVEFAGPDQAGVWRQALLWAEGLDAEALEELLGEIDLDGGPVLVAGALDEIAGVLAREIG